MSGLSFLYIKYLRRSEFVFYMSLASSDLGILIAVSADQFFQLLQIGIRIKDFADFSQILVIIGVGYHAFGHGILFGIIFFICGVPESLGQFESLSVFPEGQVISLLKTLQ